MTAARLEGAVDVALQNLVGTVSGRGRAMLPSIEPAVTDLTPQSIEPKLEYVAGKDMDQCEVEHGVWGMSILYTGDWESEVLDISAAEHEVRAALLGGLAQRAGYYLMASYD